MILIEWMVISACGTTVEIHLAHSTMVTNRLLANIKANAEYMSCWISDAEAWRSHGRAEVLGFCLVWMVQHHR